MAEIVQIPISDLLLDANNPRLTDDLKTQQETALALAAQQGDNILRLAADIVKYGLDPTALLAVVATGDRRKRYRAVEGNRRLLALQALETPNRIAAALAPQANRRLIELADKYAQDPILTVPCALFDDEAEALHWVDMRHTGQNQGVGLVEWGAEEKDRFNSRHKGSARKPAGQVIEFVEKRGALSANAKASNRKVLTNAERLLSSPYVRDKLGIDFSNGKVVALYPEQEVLKGLTRIVEDLKTGAVSVPDLYTAKLREGYIDAFKRTSLPTKATQLPEPVLLEDLTSGTKAPRKVTPTPRRRPKKRPRTTVIPKTSELEITVPRINAIYNELLTLNAEQYPNACSVTLRVFIELSVDHFGEHNKLMTNDQMRQWPLAKRMKIVAASLAKKNVIPARLKAAVDKIADGRSILAPTVPTFNQYVHNQYVFPRASDLYSTWDEIAPFMEKLWP